MSLQFKFSFKRNAEPSSSETTFAQYQRNGSTFNTPDLDSLTRDMSKISMSDREKELRSARFIIKNSTDTLWRSNSIDNNDVLDRTGRSERAENNHARSHRSRSPMSR